MFHSKSQVFTDSLYSTPCPFTSAHTLAVLVQSNSLYYFNLTNPCSQMMFWNFVPSKQLKTKCIISEKEAQGFLRKLRVCTRAYLQYFETWKTWYRKICSFLPFCCLLQVQAYLNTRKEQQDCENSERRCENCSSFHFHMPLLIAIVD